MLVQLFIKSSFEVKKKQHTYRIKIDTTSISGILEHVDQITTINEHMLIFLRVRKVGHDHQEEQINEDVFACNARHLLLQLQLACSCNLTITWPNETKRYYKIHISRFLQASSGAGQKELKMDRIN